MIRPAAPAFGIAGLSAAALLALACGGGSGASGASQRPAPLLGPSEVLRATETFLQVEGAQSQPGYYPETLRPETLKPGALAAYCPTVTRDHPDANTLRFTFDFADCPKGLAEKLSGRIILTVTLDPFGWTVVYEELAALSNNQVWRMNGVKSVSPLLATKATGVRTQNFNVAYTDGANPSNNRSYLYASELSGSWAGFEGYQLWGAYSLASAGEAPFSATIAKDQALVYASGCCYPSAGTIRFTRGGETAEATFQGTCGTVKITAGGVTETRVLAPCR
jgi:hypothetical protein